RPVQLAPAHHVVAAGGDQVEGALGVVHADAGRERGRRGGSVAYEVPVLPVDAAQQMGDLGRVGGPCGTQREAYRRHRRSIGAAAILASAPLAPGERMSKLVSAESVTEGHPDKLADRISDSVLDAILAQDPNARVAAETLLTKGLALVAGEVTTTADVDV